MSAAQSNHDPALAHQAGPQQGPAAAATAAAATAAQPGGPAASDLPSILGMTQDQVLSLLRTLPNVFTKVRAWIAVGNERLRGGSGRGRWWAVVGGGW